jgi:hypothetical protein
MNLPSKPIENGRSTVNVEVIIEEDNKEDHNDEMFVEIVNAT